MRLSPLGTSAINWTIVPAPDECGAVSAMRIGRGNLSTRRKPAPVLLCPPQIPHDLTRARTLTTAVRSRRLIVWDMTRHSSIWLFLPRTLDFAWLTFRPWRWRRHSAPKCRSTFTLYSKISNSSQSQLWELRPTWYKLMFLSFGKLIRMSLLFWSVVNIASAAGDEVEYWCSCGYYSLGRSQPWNCLFSSCQNVSCPF
jgi:hypothetical protein